MTATNGTAEIALDELRAFLTEALGVDTIYRSVTGVSIYGYGEDALVDVHLSGDTRPLHFKRYNDMLDAKKLSNALVTQLGVAKTFGKNGPQPNIIAQAVFRLAKHHAESDATDAALEWGYEYLRLASAEEVDMGDQAARWRAFEALSRVAPARDAGEDRSPQALAGASLVLVDITTGDRLVRAGWFQSYVKREVGGRYSPEALTQIMERAGWHQRGTQGRIKASCPSDRKRRLVWAFYTVPADWEDTRVNAGDSLYARAGTGARARSPIGTPAFTRHPEPAADGRWSA